MKSAVVKENGMIDMIRSNQMLQSPGCLVRGSLGIMHFYGWKLNAGLVGSGWIGPQSEWE